MSDPTIPKYLFDDLALWQTCNIVLLNGATLILASPCVLSLYRKKITFAIRPVDDMMPHGWENDEK